MDVVGVNIDAAIAQFGEHRYPIANLSSYRTAETFESKTTLLRLGCYSILFLVFCAWVLDGRDLWVGKERYIIYGGFVGLFALVDFLPVRKAYTYTLFLRTAGGEQLAFSTQSLDEMNTIEKELRAAISGGVIRVAANSKTSRV